MTVLLDTCVIIDFLQKREPFYKDAYTIMRYAAAENFSAYTTAKASADIYYLTYRCTHSKNDSREIIDKLFSIIGLLDTSAEDVFRAVSSQIGDFEDAIMVETGRRNNLDCIVTRNKKDYEESPVTIYSPEEFLSVLKKDIK